MSSTSKEASTTTVPRCSNYAAFKVWKEKFNNWVGSTYNLRYCALLEPNAVEIFTERERLGACPRGVTRADLEDRHAMAISIDRNNVQWEKYDSDKSRIIAFIKTAFEDYTQITHEMRTDQVLTVAMREHDLIVFYKQLNIIILRRGYASYTRERQLFVELCTYTMKISDTYHEFQHNWNLKLDVLRSIGCKFTTAEGNDESWKILYLGSLHDAYWHDWRAKMMNEHCAYRALKSKWDTDPPLIRGAMPLDTLPATLAQIQRLCDDHWNTHGANDIEKMRVTWSDSVKAVAAAQSKTVAAVITKPIVKPAEKSEERTKHKKRGRDTKDGNEGKEGKKVKGDRPPLVNQCADCPGKKPHTNTECWKKHPELIPEKWKTASANPPKKLKAEVKALLAYQDEDVYCVLTETIHAIRHESTRQDIGLDSMASINATCNLEYLCNDTTGRDIHLHTVGGSRTANRTGQFVGFEEAGDTVYINDTGINLLSLGAMAKISHVYYNNEDEEFVLTNIKNPRKVDIFRLHPTRNVYLHVPSDVDNSECYEDINAAIIDSTATATLDRYTSYTGQHIERARLARALCAALRHPGNDEMVEMLRGGFLHNCPLTAADYDRANTLWGRCKGCALGKMTTRSRIRNVTDRPEQLGERVSVDFMFFRSPTGAYVIMVAADNSPFGYRRAYNCKSKHLENALKDGLNLLILDYAAITIKIRRLQCDHEAVFKSTKAAMSEKGITIEVHAPGVKDPYAEKLIDYLRGRHRATVAAMSPYCKLPMSLTPYSLSDLTNMLMLAPPSISALRFSPFEMLTNTKMPYNAIVRAPFGQAVMATIPNSSRIDNQPVAEFGIIVGHSDHASASVTVYFPDKLPGHQIATRHAFQTIQPSPEQWASITREANREEAQRDEYVRALKSRRKPKQDIVDWQLVRDSDKPAEVTVDEDPIPDIDLGHFHLTAPAELPVIIRSATAVVDDEVNEVRQQPKKGSMSGDVRNEMLENRNAPSTTLRKVVPMQLPHASFINTEDIAIHPGLSPPKRKCDTLRRDHDLNDDRHTASGVGDPSHQQMHIDNAYVPPQGEQSLIIGQQPRQTTYKANAQRSSHASKPQADSSSLTRNGRKLKLPARYDQHAMHYFSDNLDEIYQDSEDYVPRLIARADVISARTPMPRHIPAVAAAVHNSVTGRYYRNLMGALLHAGELHDADETVAAVISLHKAMKENHDRTIIALEKELAGLIVPSRPVIRPIHAREMSTTPIPASTKSKQKFLSDGTFDKDKVRICAMGNCVREKLGKERTSSPTADNMSVQTHCQKIQMHKLFMMSVDIDTAYFNAILEREVNMIIGPTETEVLIKMRPEWKCYVRTNKTMLVRVIRALYGLPECSKLFYDFMNTTLTAMGFKRSSVDPAVFIKSLPSQEHDAVITMHVDDLLVSAPTISELDSIAQQLTDGTNGITVKRSDHLSYLGLNIIYQRQNDIMTVDQIAYIGTMLELEGYEEGIGHKPRTPGNHSFLIQSEGELLPDQEQFMSKLMKAMYAAKRTRPDILFVCSALAQRMYKANAEDDKRLDHLYRYLNATRKLGLTLTTQRDQEQVMQCFIDAAYAEHIDAKSHTGANMNIPLSATLVASSKKQSVVAKSSTEAELIALDAGAEIAERFQMLLSEFKMVTSPGVIYQDNKSTILLAEAGRPLSRATKHIKVRYFSIKEKLEQGLFKIEYLPTEEMVADILTKPLAAEAFLRLRPILLGRTTV